MRLILMSVCIGCCTQLSCFIVQYDQANYLHFKPINGYNQADCLHFKPINLYDQTNCLHSNQSICYTHIHLLELGREPHWLATVLSLFTVFRFFVLFFSPLCFIKLLDRFGATLAAALLCIYNIAILSPVFN